MANKRGFWQVLMAALLALYAAATLLVAIGEFGHVLVRLAVIVLAAHVLEIPLAYRMLKDRKPDAGRLIVSTLLFGLVWWVPARRGLFASN